MKPFAAVETLRSAATRYDLKNYKLTSEMKRYGRVSYNDGELAEVQSIGMEELESGLLLETIQLPSEKALA
jgi:hypothetical protein